MESSNEIWDSMHGTAMSPPGKATYERQTTSTFRNTSPAGSFSSFPVFCGLLPTQPKTCKGHQCANRNPEKPHCSGLKRRKGT
jgi:hypothetical protein